jgi:alpha-L-arabinofuranosidase
MEDVNHEIYGGIYSQMIFGEAFAEPARGGVSEMWRASGDAKDIKYSLTVDAPFKGEQSQRIERAAPGAWGGIENRGLNRQGMSVVAAKPYEGTIVLRSNRPTSVRVSFQSGDGKTTYAQQMIDTLAGAWHTYRISLTPSETDDHARFAIEIDSASVLDTGYALVQPGSWGRYKNLPVRDDIAHAMIDQGLQAIRFGGCANSGCGDVSDYKWKAMIGDPVSRPVTRGFWYPYESNGFGIFEFLQLGESLGIEAVSSLNIDETPNDIRDLMDYLYGSNATAWGARRIADGHPAPYKVHRFELGNEDAVNDAYFMKFKALADVIWSYDPTIRLVVGDFTYLDVIRDPFDFTGGGKVNTLSAHQKILRLAAKYGAEVDFDVHLWTRGSDDGGWDRKDGNLDSQIAALDSYAAALKTIAPKDAKFKVVVFELNADSHDLTRALANAYTITALQRRPYLDVVSSANAFQVDGQNDNDWNQGLIFMDQAKVWFQPPYFVHQMIARSQRQQVIRINRTGEARQIEATAFRDSNGTSLHIVNISGRTVTYEIDFGSAAAGADALVTTLGGLRGRAVNTSRNPTNIVPESYRLKLNNAGQMQYEMAPLSFTTIQLRN